MMSTGASSSTAYKPRCGVIGTGEEGSALIYKLTKHGLEVRMANAGDSECLSELASKTGAYAVAMEDVVRDVDIVFLCIPMKAIPELPKQMFAKCPEKTIVVDCCNYYPSRDGSIPEIEQGMPESLWVKKEIGHDVIKAFNSILAGALKDCGRPHDSGMRIALPISGDDEKAKENVSNLMNELGFDVCDCGPLSHSWKQQPGSPIYCTNLAKEELCNAMAKVSKEELPKMRDRAYHKMIHAGKELDWQSLVNLLRETYNPSMSKEMQQQQGMTTATREPIST